MSSLVDDVIAAGIKDGMRHGAQKSVFDQCDGRDEPQERCPMPTSVGCACYAVIYRNAPFWRRLFMEKPSPEPSFDDCVRECIRRHVEDGEILHVISKGGDA
jgi:hypothetical protein